MTREEAYKNYDDEVEKLEANCTCQDYFNAGWDACEEVWLTDNPDKDLMIAELEGLNKKLKDESYEGQYVAAYKRNAKYLQFFAILSATLASGSSDTDKLKKIEEEFNKIRNNL